MTKINLAHFFYYNFFYRNVQISLQIISLEPKSCPKICYIWHSNFGNREGGVNLPPPLVYTGISDVLVGLGLTLRSTQIVNTNNTYSWKGARFRVKTRRKYDVLMRVIGSMYFYFSPILVNPQTLDTPFFYLSRNKINIKLKRTHQLPNEYYFF